VKTAQGRQYAKIKMHIVQALGLGYERLIDTAFVKLCNKHEDKGRTLLDSSHEQTVSIFRPFLLFPTGVDC